MRDQLRSIEDWHDYFDTTRVLLERYETRLNDPTIRFDRKIMTAYGKQDESFDLVSALYSSGAPIPDCVMQARKLLLAVYPQFISVCQENPKQARNDYGGGWDFRTRYLALAVLCRLSPEESRPLVDALDFWPERDAVWERFIAYLGHGKGRPPVSQLVWPEAYASLLEALDPEGTDLTHLAALMTYDKGWLKEMRSATNPFYSNHNNKHNT